MHPWHTNTVETRMAAAGAAGGAATEALQAPARRVQRQRGRRRRHALGSAAGRAHGCAARGALTPCVPTRVFGGLPALAAPAKGAQRTIDRAPDTARAGGAGRARAQHDSMSLFPLSSRKLYPSRLACRVPRAHSSTPC
eukprot:2517434-Prymnesium_polylepis.2